MNEYITQFLKMIFAKTNTLTIIDVLVLHFHMNFKQEMYHVGLGKKYGIRDVDISNSYDNLRSENLITFDSESKTITVKTKGQKFFNNKISKKIAFHILKDVREKWFDKLWAVYPIKIGKKKSKELFLSINFTEEMFNLVMSSIDKQVKYKAHMDAKNEFYPQFKHLERWIKNEEWDNEVPDINTKKVITLGRN